MITLRFWGALQRPPIQHPLFRRTTRRFQPTYEPVKRSLPSRAGLAVMAFSGVVFALIIPQALGIVILFLPMLISGGYSIFFGTLAGSAIALRVGGVIARERERGSLELIAVTPRGGFEALWAICTGCQYYDQRWRGAGTHDVWFSRIIFLGILVISSMFTLSDSRAYPGSPGEAFVITVITALLTGLAFQIDDIHSMVIGSLVGLIVPLVLRIHFWTLISFIALQALAYLLTLLGGFVIIPLLLMGLRLDWFAGQVALPLTQLLVFFATRELIARALWLSMGLLMRVRGDLGDPRELSAVGL